MGDAHKPTPDQPATMSGADVLVHSLVRHGVEVVFAYPGIGYTLLAAVQNLDYPLMQGLFLTITTFVLIANFLVDIVYVRLDPRVRVS